MEAGLTVAAAFPKGVIAQPTWLKEAAHWVMDNLGVSAENCPDLDTMSRAMSAGCSCTVLPARQVVIWYAAQRFLPRDGQLP